MPDEIELAVESLRRGGVVVLPTDTVYGIGALPDRPDAVAKIFAAKGRPEDKALPVLGASLEDLAPVAILDAGALALAERYWPGPLTLVLSRTETFTADLGGSDDRTIAVRIPENDVALALLRAAGPLAVTSANRSGEDPAGDVETARRAFGDAVDVYLDGGPSDGRASTVASLLDGLTILRAGAVTEDELRQVLT